MTWNLWNLIGQFDINFVRVCKRLNEGVGWYVGKPVMYRAVMCKSVTCITCFMCRSGICKCFLCGSAMGRSVMGRSVMCTFYVQVSYV